MVAIICAPEASASPEQLHNCGMCCTGLGESRGDFVRPTLIFGRYYHLSTVNCSGQGCFLDLIIIWRAQEVLIVFIGHCIGTKTMIALITLSDIGA